MIFFIEQKIDTLISDEKKSNVKMFKLHEKKKHIYLSHICLTSDNCKKKT